MLGGKVRGSWVAVGRGGKNACAGLGGVNVPGGADVGADTEGFEDQIANGLESQAK